MTLHTKLSYIKSAARIAGYICLLFDVITGVVILVLSELIGIAEELPGSYKGTETGAWSKDSVADGVCDDATGEPFVLPKEWIRNSGTQAADVWEPFVPVSHRCTICGRKISPELTTCIKGCTPPDNER